MGGHRYGRGDAGRPRCAAIPSAFEAGLPLHGHELGPGITPLEAGLSWVVAWDKPGGFTGRDALLEQRAKGVQRLLRGIVGEGRQPLTGRVQPDGPRGGRRRTDQRQLLARVRGAA